MATKNRSLSLQELLRRRRKLPVAEVTLLMNDLPKLVENTAKSPVGQYLQRLHVHFPGVDGDTAEATVERPVAEWPAFQLSWVPKAEQSGERETEVPPARAGGPPALIAALLYELLGGSLQNLDRPYTPLPSLNEPANDVLRQALAQEPFPDWRVFWAAWCKATEQPPRPATPGTASRRLLPVESAPSEEMSLLELVPSVKGICPLLFLAGDVCRIGRSPLQSNLPIQPAPRGGAAGESRKISRVHVTLSASEETLWIRDGDGVNASRNGSRFDGVPLASGLDTRLDHSGLLELGPVPHAVEIAVSICARAMERDAGGAGATLPLTLRPSKQIGAVVLDGLHPPSPPTAVWLRHSFPCDHSGRHFFGQPPAMAPLAFLLRHGSFWLANLRLSTGTLKCAGQMLRPGELMLLRDGEVIDCPGVSYRCRAQARPAR